jgi:hypothetical protein
MRVGNVGMEILKFANAGAPLAKKSNNLKSIAGLATVAAFAVIGSTLAANLSLNGGSAIEFGQGVSVTAACDSDGITVTPSVRFVNAANGGTFYLSTIAMSGIDFTDATKCVGKTFTLNAYDDGGATPLQLATSSGGSTPITSATFSNSSGTNYVGTNGISVTGSGNGGATGAITLGFGTPSSTSGAVYKITLQSQ